MFTLHQSVLILACLDIISHRKIISDELYSFHVLFGFHSMYCNVCNIQFNILIISGSEANVNLKWDSFQSSTGSEKI